MSILVTFTFIHYNTPYRMPNNQPSNSSSVYSPSVIEPQWQQRWRDTNSNVADDTATQPTYYCLDMFPYPSANGLHVGHPEGYTATDIVSRYKRMTGHSVLHPMGWDAFGLPAENYAIKTGVEPNASTHENITTFRRQIQALGLSYDWSREIDTSSPEYYKWTQWMFLQMYNKGLAYKKKAKVNWCNSCQTVLANEQVVDGKCERSKDEVVQKDLEQWFFKITDYVEPLLNDLETIDWPEPIKLMQRNWIGRQEGITITYKIDGVVDHNIECFTKYPETNFGATFIVVAPEHPIVQNIVTQDQRAAVEQYVQECAGRNELQRTDLNKDKSGVFTGRYAINPLTNYTMPIWVADFVLAHYGTGMVVGVPAHDQRDFDFAKKYNLEIQRVIITPDGDESPVEHAEQVDHHGTMINSDFLNGQDAQKEAKAAMMDHMEAKNMGKRVIFYNLRDWLISRQRYWGAPIPIVYDPAGNPHSVKEEHLPLELPTDVDYTPKGTSPLGSSQAYIELAEKLYGEGWRFEVDTMDTFVCSSWYYLRYCDPNNTKQFASQEKLAHWLPVDMYVGGAEHAVLHLLYARFFHKALQDMGHIPKQVGPEPFAALRNQGMILGEDHQKMSKSLGNVVNPDEIVEEFGADTLRLYEMFMGPFEDVKPWNTESIKGPHRFLDRIYKIAIAHKNLSHVQRERFKLNALIKKVTEDIEAFRFNTAISAMMIYINDREFGNVEGTEWDKDAFKQFIIVLAPFAPHLAAEVWQLLGESGDVAEQTWPEYDEAMLIEDTMTIVVQVNGKVRDQISVATDMNEEDLKAQAQATAGALKHSEGKAITKVIYVPRKLVNIVVQ